MNTQVKERPILFGGPMVKAILSGQKTQTRRTVRFKPPYDHPGSWPFVSKYPDGWWVWTDFQPTEKDLTILRQNGNGRPCPYGEIGDRLWVRETWADVRGKGFDNDLFPVGVSYKAECDADSLRIAKEYGVKWKPSIHMPRWASRIILDVTGIRVERLQDISPDDCRAEGMPHDNNDIGVRYAYGQLWNLINGDGSWDKNPWVWVIEFRINTT